MNTKIGGRDSYVTSKNKRIVRKQMIGVVAGKTVLTLLGKNPDVAKQELLDAGVDKIISYEIDPEIFGYQQFVKDERTMLKLGDVFKANIGVGVISDFDLCSTIKDKGIKEAIYKFRDHDMAWTFCVRKIGIKNTLAFFARYLGENTWEIDHCNDDSWLITTPHYTHIAKTWRDGSPMIMIRKLLNK